MQLFHCGKCEHAFPPARKCESTVNGGKCLAGTRSGRHERTTIHTTFTVLNEMPSCQEFRLHIQIEESAVLQIVTIETDSKGRRQYNVNRASIIQSRYSGVYDHGGGIFCIKATTKISHIRL